MKNKNKKISKLLGHVSNDSNDLKECVRCHKTGLDDTVALLCSNIICIQCLSDLKSDKVKRIECLKCKINHNIGKYIDLVDKHSLEEANLLDVFQFDDDLFSKDTNVEIDLNDIDILPNLWLKTVIEQHDKLSNKLSIFHLNLNSIYNKIDDVDLVLNLNLYDIIMINESKLDDSVPIDFYSNQYYRILRRDRGGTTKGGGILVFVKKSIELLFSFNSTEFEFIYFELKVNGSLYAFMSVYKSPRLKDDLFLNGLQDFILTRDMNIPLFIIGDLNMDLANDFKSKYLVQFMNLLKLNNYVNVSTRDGKRWNEQAQKYSYSNTILDVILHNKNLVHTVSTIPFYNSDHKTVLAFCDIFMKPNQTKNQKRLQVKAILSVKSIEQITDCIFHSKNWFDQIIDSNLDIDGKWLSIKIFINNLIIKFSKKIKLKYPKGNCYPWFDKELYQLKRSKEKCYLEWIHCKSSFLSKEAFSNAKLAYNKAYRLKQTNYFSDKSPSDFKNSKKFWNFYSQYVKLKRDGSKDNNNNFAISVNDVISNDKSVVSNAFVDFFSNLSSSSISTIDESKQFIFEHFRTHKLGVNGAKFSFSHINAESVLDLINNLDNNGSPGISNIPIKIFKNSKSTLSEVFAKIFNCCIVFSKTRVNQLI
jgi:hypothetical protein